jgi:flagellar assembly protein FliH
MTAKIVKSKDIQRRTGLSEKPAHKHMNVDAEGGGVLDRRVISAVDKAEKIITEAEAEAASIRGEAEKIKNDIEKAREKARKEGFSAGEAEGKARTTEALVALENKRERFYADAEPEIIKLSVAIAEKVIGTVASERPDVVKDVVRQALERSIGDRIVVRLNPQDYATVMSENYEFKDVIDRTKRIMFKEDEAIVKGGCIVETEVGTIDAQLETQMEAIKKALEI